LPTPVWRVEIVDEAHADLKRLYRRRRKVWQTVIRLIQELETDPYCGDSCDPPLEDLRRRRFWNDRYRLVWLVVPDEQEVDVLMVAEKDSTLYEAVYLRLRDVVDRHGDD
jgi:Txe/YoeB family toxin of Txe-Axe toxin-antitoxin module